MVADRTDELFVGLIALALVPLISWRIVRGLRDGRLAIYRTYLDRDQNQVKFAVLLGLHVLSVLLIAVVAADLLFDLGVKEML